MVSLACATVAPTAPIRVPSAPKRRTSLWAFGSKDNCIQRMPFNAPADAAGRRRATGKGRAGAAQGRVAWRISERAEGMEQPPAHRTTHDTGPLELPAR
jgi:hypothetical protein